MIKKIRIVLAQLNLCVGDIQGNLIKLMDAANSARDDLNADLIVFPELSITGYPAEDLLFRKDFIDKANKAFYEFKSKIKNIYCLISHPQLISQGLFNTASLIHNDLILARYAKEYLPNYTVFDEPRYFKPGQSSCVILIKNIPVGILICEDLWNPHPITQAASQGARLILVPNASPFETNKHELRYELLSKRAKAANLPIVYVNCVGLQDDILFDGGSMVVNQNGDICQFSDFYTENLIPVDFEVGTAETKVITKTPFIIPSEEQRIYDGLVLGVRDYLAKNNFTSALIGVSGGIDSALTLAIAVDALGKNNVEAIFMPSRFTAEESKKDALLLIKNLGVNHQIISIEDAFTAFLKTLAPSFKESSQDITEENIQSRCRGLILMALANKFHKIVLATGNRSEFATGYTTLYGDMCGGLAVLKDVPKTLVYRLARYRNQISPVIPKHTIERAPTAELAPNQKDEDSLAPYPILDEIIELYINQECSVDEIISKGFNEALVKKMIKLINRNEYKRKQAPIGIRINNKAFGRDRRYPVTSKFDIDF